MRSRPLSKKVRVGVVGVGNCASSLVQGVHYYRDAAEDALVPGLMHPRLGDYHVGDVEFACAFDVDRNKVGKDLGQAIYAQPNNTTRFADVGKLGVPVHAGDQLDGIGRYTAELVKPVDGPRSDVARILEDTGTDVLINYLPVG